MGDSIDNPLALDRQHFATAIKKAAEVYQCDHFIVVGRGSLSVSMPDAPDVMRTTGDIVLFSTFDQTRVDAWAAADPSVGAGSEFFDQHGFYIQRVGEWTLMDQPEGWQDRAIKLNLEGIDVLVLHSLDLAYNKLEAGRDKDIEFIAEGLRCEVYQLDIIEDYIRKGAKEDCRLDMMLTNLQRARKLAGGEPA
ncbi:MAG: DUF6036 family nucleotidyltransferase [Prosthecobacter sp.]|uniref:DUF6036 family nucleotidyltransferase n=1 Tax=Prosthecobacter sp. TaxID=1965333 RepID=UPI0039024C97